MSRTIQDRIASPLRRIATPLIAAVMFAGAAHAQDAIDKNQMQARERVCELVETMAGRAAKAYQTGRPLSELRKELRALATAEMPKIAAAVEAGVAASAAQFDEYEANLKQHLLTVADDAAFETYKTLRARALLNWGDRTAADYASEAYAACVQGIQDAAKGDKQ